MYLRSSFLGSKLPDLNSCNSFESYATFLCTFVDASSFFFFFFHCQQVVYILMWLAIDISSCLKHIAVLVISRFLTSVHFTVIGTLKLGSFLQLSTGYFCEVAQSQNLRHLNGFYLLCIRTLFTSVASAQCTTCFHMRLLSISIHLTLTHINPPLYSAILIPAAKVQIFSLKFSVFLFSGSLEWPCIQT